MPRFGGIPVEEQRPRFGGQPVQEVAPEPAPIAQPIEQPQTISQEWAQYEDMPFGERLQSIIKGIPRAAGLGARAALEGIGGAVEFVGTPLKIAVEQATGQPVDLGGVASEALGLPTPETPTERIVGTAESMMAGAGGMAGTAGKLSQMAKTDAARKILQSMAARPEAQLISAASSGIAGETAKEMGASPEAQLTASLVAGLTAPGAPSALKKGKQATQAFMKAHKLGYKVPPALAKPTQTQKFIEGGVAGSSVTRQAAAAKNQEVTNNLIKQDIGYPKDMPLSTEGLAQVRANAGQAYNEAKKIGVFNADDTYMNDLKKVAQTGSAMAKDFPEAVKRDVVDMAKIYAKKSMSAEGTVEAVKQLRADATAGFPSPDPAIRAMAKAKGKVADALEGLMEREAAQKAPEVVPNLRAARQLIAKTYSIEKALKGENIDARILGRQLDKGKPLSGLTKEVGEFGRNFKGAAAVPEGGVQPSNFRVTDLLLSSGLSGVTGNAGYMALLAFRPALRATILSKPYQKMLAGIRPKQVQKIMQLPKEARAVQMLGLYHELQDKGEIPDNLPEQTQQ
jgi:hypothetical protein